MPQAVVQSPQVFGDSLAQVLHREAGKTTVLGQAFLVAPGQLATCGHVVEHYASNAQAVVIKFPASGNEYVAARIKLHPSFSRQVDQLVKYDAALIFVDLKAPEVSAAFLPLRFNKGLKTQQTLWAMRYPAHLGVLSSAPAPLIQEGQLLGPLRKEDNFHLLHDLGLSPGDSGSALFDNETVVAMHCGDTASIPGLNLPTTSIRMALWIDALRDLGVPGNQNRILQHKSGKLDLLARENIAAFAILAVTGFVFAAAVIFFKAQIEKNQNIAAIAPVEIQCQSQIVPGNGTPTKTKALQLTITPYAPARIYAFFTGDEHTSLLYPQKNSLTSNVANQTVSLTLPNDCESLLAQGKGHLEVAIVNPQFSLLRDEDIVVRDPNAMPIFSDAKKSLAMLTQFENAGNALVKEISTPASSEKNQETSSSESVSTTTAVEPETNKHQ